MNKIPKYQENILRGFRKEFESIHQEHEKDKARILQLEEVLREIENSLDLFEANTLLGHIQDVIDMASLPELK